MSNHESVIKLNHADLSTGQAGLGQVRGSIPWTGHVVKPLSGFSVGQFGPLGHCCSPWGSRDDGGRGVLRVGGSPLGCNRSPSVLFCASHVGSSWTRGPQQGRGNAPDSCK